MKKFTLILIFFLCFQTVFSQFNIERIPALLLTNGPFTYDISIDPTESNHWICGHFTKLNSSFYNNLIKTDKNDQLITMPVKSQFIKGIQSSRKQKQTVYFLQRVNEIRQISGL